MTMSERQRLQQGRDGGYLRCTRQNLQERILCRVKGIPPCSLQVRASNLERFRFISAHARTPQGGSFLMKEPLGGIENVRT